MMHTLTIAIHAAGTMAVCAVFAMAWPGQEQPEMPHGKGDDPKTLPAERGGQDLIGDAWPPLAFEAWLETPGGGPLDTTGRITLYRWWTDGCPYCERSLPAIEQLRVEFEPRGVQFVCVYHPKPPRDITAADHQRIIDAARKRGYRGPLAIDQDWSQLERLWLDTGSRDATSASFLVDSRASAPGVIRFVHPGPQFFASDDPDHAQENQDYNMLRDAIITLLADRDLAPEATESGEDRLDANEH